MYRGKKVAVVVPAYNEEEHIGAVLKGMPAFVDRVYVVDDGSTDATYHIASDIAGTNGRSVSVVRHTHNRGVGAAIVTGYKEALAEDIDVAVVMAGDNQMNPAELPGLLTPVVEGDADYTKGSRMTDPGHLEGMTPWRRLGNCVLLKWLTWIASGNRRIMDPQHGYTAITKEALNSINLDAVFPYYGYCNDILVKLSVAGIRVLEIPMPSRYQGEKSKIRYSRYVPRVSMLLLRCFLWRLRVQYFPPHHRHNKSKVEKAREAI